MNNLIYDRHQKPRKWHEWILYPLQMVMAVFVATVLIANLCHTDPAAALLGACIGTLTYQVITKFKSPMFISSCGATVSAVCGALCSTGAQYVDGQWVGNPNYLMVIMGGLLIIAIYSIFALIIRFKGIQSINKIFPPVVVGGVTMVIGLNLAKFLITYCGQFGAIDASGTILNMSVINNPKVITGVLIAIATMVITAVVSHYGKGFMKNIPFLFGIVGGYILTIILQFSIPYFSENPLISFEAFNNLQWYPDVPFAHPEYFVWDWAALGQTVIYFLPVAICALLEHYSDHKTLSNIIGHDLTEDPGLHRTLLGDGVASAVGTIVCGQPNTSYGESIATIGFSKVASVIVTTVAAVILGLLSFFAPLNAFIQTVPQFVFGGCAMILYGFIAASGLKTIMNNKVDLENNKNLVILSVVLTVGVGGIALGLESLKGVSLAMVLGVLLNLILRDKEKNIIEYNKKQIKWNGESPIDKTFLIAPMCEKGQVMIFNKKGDLLVQHDTDGFPCHLTQLPDLTGYSYFSGSLDVGPESVDGYFANGRYLVGKFFITDNKLNTTKIIDYIPTEKTKNAIGIHMHGSYVLGKDHYLLQIISLEEVMIDNIKSYVVNCILQEQKDNQVIWEWASIDAPELFNASFCRNNYFDEDVMLKKYASDYAHMNSVVRTSDGKYLYISFKHIGIVKIDYRSKKVLWVLGANAKKDIETPDNFVYFRHQHDLHLIDDETIYFWDNKHLSYVEIGIKDKKIVHYKTINYPTDCSLSVMGNAIRPSDDVIDVCYGLRSPASAHTYLQPIVSEFNMKTGEKFLDITINARTDQLVNVMYQINRGINIYENK